MNKLPLSVFEEIGKYLDLKGFITILSLTKKIRAKILSSNIKIRGVEISCTKDKLYSRYKKYFTGLNVSVGNDDCSFLTKIVSRVGDNIQSLDLSRNKIEDGTVGGCISKLVNLRILDLSYCNITDKSVKFISASIHSLNISHCNITNNSVKYISKLVNLRDLNLSGCYKITDRAFGKYLPKLVNLQSLDISWCDQITDTGIIEGLSSLYNLQKLNLSLCSITDRSIESLRNLVNLQDLNLRDCDLTDEGFKNLCNFVNLRILNLSWCLNITDKGVREGLGNLINLHFLDLSSCKKVSDQGIKCLRKFSKLKYLDLSGCGKITIDTVKGFTRKDLIYLDVSECPNITQRDMDELDIKFKYRV